MLDKPNFFIVGAPRSGTTSMWKYLNQHPEIFMSKDKEPDYFAKDKKIPMHYYENLNDYLKLFKPVKGKKAVGEASVVYLSSNSAPEEIKKNIKNPKILIMLRDPVGFISSYHALCYSTGLEKEKDLGKAISLESQRIKKIQGKQKVPSVDESICYVYFLKTMYRNTRRWLELFGKENVLIILYDDFQANPEKEYAKLLGFLGVDKRFKPDFCKYQSNKTPKSLTWLRFRVLIRKLPRQALDSMRFVVPRKLRTKLSNMNFRYEPRKPIPKELQEDIKRMFYYDVKLLGRTINRNLSKWIKQ